MLMNVAGQLKRSVPCKSRSGNSDYHTTTPRFGTATASCKYRHNGIKRTTGGIPLLLHATCVGLDNDKVSNLTPRSRGSPKKPEKYETDCTTSKISHAFGPLYPGRSPPGCSAKFASGRTEVSTLFPEFWLLLTIRAAVGPS